MARRLMKDLKDAVKFLKKQYKHTPEVGIVLGTGLGKFSDEIQIEEEIDYSEIPHFPISTVIGHKGKLIFGKLEGKRVVLMSGRFHFYEGYTTDQVIFPIRVLKLFGIKALLLSNAAGAVNPDFKVGDLMIIRDHVSFFVHNPLIGKNLEELGTRFPDMSEPYSKVLIEKARDAGRALHIELKEGIYFAVTGPTFETHAEYKVVKILGGDAVGMSTVQECIVANHMKLPVFAMSVITDIGIREDDSIITHEEVLKAAKDAEPKFAAIFKEIISSI